MGDFPPPGGSTNRQPVTLADITMTGAVQPLPNAACDKVTVVALPTNDGTRFIRVGDANIGANQGTPLSPGTPCDFQVSNLAYIYYYGTAPDKISVTYT